MSFTIPNKKRSQLSAIVSPQIKKKPKPNEFNGKDDYFADNFSEYFHSQFIQQMNKAENGNCSQRKVLNSTITSDLQVNHGIEEISDDDLDELIPLAQRTVHHNETEIIDIDDDNDAIVDKSQIDDEKDEFNTAISIDADDANDLNLDHSSDHGICNSSQLFLHEISAIQINVNSIIDDALNDDRFTVFKSNVTSSQYIHLQRNSNDISPRNDKEISVEENQNKSGMNDDDIEAFNQTNAFDALLAAGIDEFNNKSNNNNDATHQGNNTINKMQPVTASKFYNLGPFYGLPKKVLYLIQQFKRIDDLYDWQKECLRLPAIENKHNLIYALPTSGGKTLVSEILIIREIMCRKKNCLFILPYVSIVQEKVYAMAPFALNLDFLVEEYAAGKGCLPPRKRRNKKSVYIATIEKAMALFDSLLESDRANEIGLVVIDEIHIIGEGSRGAVMESFLSKVQYVKAGIQIVGMSATIGNLKELAQFLNADIYSKDFRPVELTEYVKCGSDLMRMKKDACDIENIFEFDRTLNFGYKEEVLKMDPDHITGLVAEIIPEKSCLIFCPSKNNCESLATLVSRILPKKYMKHKEAERINLIKAIESDMNSKICPILNKTIRYGIAYHHSGLTADERRHLEDAFRQNILCVICCTSTLAAGVNLPAKRVIIRSPYVGKDFITLSKYKQMIGRAGRAGFGDSGESILICSTNDSIRVTELLFSPMDEVISQLPLNDGKALSALVLSAVGLDLASSRTEIQELFQFTLLHLQAERLQIDIVQLIDEQICKLFKSKVLKISKQSEDNENGANLNDSIAFNEEIQFTQKKILIKGKTKFEVSQVGKSSFKSGIDLDRVKLVHNNLLTAQQSLVLSDHLHLLYIVTPSEDNTNFLQMPDSKIFYAKYDKLNANQRHTAHIIGVTETVAQKFASGRPLKTEIELIIRKFYITMVLNELWEMKTVSDVSNSFKLSRGLVQNLMGMAAIEASCLQKYCDELDDFWMFRELFRYFTQRLSNICSTELLPLMELPCVRRGRAIQLFTAGFKKIEDIAKAKPMDLVNAIEHLSHRVASQLVSAAKVLVLERLENLREEVQDCLDICAS